mmetsp:Transcript_25551/g.66037  ORF Transcript_25551/g.66037 Transcript_25551/m.66037 type:complete len:223 (-) Transcript_25551:454-1122(-)
MGAVRAHRLPLRAGRACRGAPACGLRFGVAVAGPARRQGVACRGRWSEGGHGHRGHPARAPPVHALDVRQRPSPRRARDSGPGSPHSAPGEAALLQHRGDQQPRCAHTHDDEQPWLQDLRLLRGGLARVLQRRVHALRVEVIPCADARPRPRERVPGLPADAGRHGRLACAESSLRPLPRGLLPTARCRHRRRLRSTRLLGALRDAGRRWLAPAGAHLRQPV